MTHVLIIVSWLGVANGAVISTQEFTSAERCDAARQALIEYAKARSADETLRPLCIPSLRRRSRVQLVGGPSCPTANTPTQFDQCCLPIDLYHRTWIVVELDDGKYLKGNARRRTSSCRCVGRLGSQMLYFKQAGFPPTTITRTGIGIRSSREQKAPSRPVGRQFLSSASPHCYFERLICHV